MTAFIAAFLLAHFEAGAGWWWAYGVLLALTIFGLASQDK